MLEVKGHWGQRVAFLMMLLKQFLLTKLELLETVLELLEIVLFPSVKIKIQTQAMFVKLIWYP